MGSLIHFSKRIGTAKMILIASCVVLLVLTRAVVESSVSCGGHHAPSCGDCGPQHWCNGDCSWSEPQQICKGGYGGELFHATIAVAYDQLFSEQMRGDQRLRGQLRQSSMMLIERWGQSQT